MGSVPVTLPSSSKISQQSVITSSYLDIIIIFSTLCVFVPLANFLFIHQVKKMKELCKLLIQKVLYLLLSWVRIFSDQISGYQHAVVDNSANIQIICKGKTNDVSM